MYLKWTIIAIKNGKIYPLKLYTVQVKKSNIGVILGKKQLTMQIKKNGSVEDII